MRSAAGKCSIRGAEHGLEPPDHPVHHAAKGERQKLVAAGEVVADGPDGQPGFVCHFPQGRPFQAVNGNDPQDGFDNFLAPGFGINNFGHPYYLAHLCPNVRSSHRCPASGTRRQAAGCVG